MTNPYDLITERIVALLEQGTVPWRKPWNVKAGMPRNLLSKKPYRGVNTWLLHSMQYESPFWLTYRQALELGGHVRKGEKACPVVFWKQLSIEDDATGETEKIPMARLYSVFNVAQCEGIKSLPAGADEHPVSLSKPDEIVEHMPNRPEIRHGMRQAFYSPKQDTVSMPDRERFNIEADYFGTLFHELIHSTGHASRLNRSAVMNPNRFGSNPYSKEELVAEMGSAFLCGHAGIAEQILANSAAYIQNWLTALQNDRKLVVQAAAQAQKAVDFMLCLKYEESPNCE